jgi:tRNA (guanine9-N1)-methyltransferase
MDQGKPRASKAEKRAVKHAAIKERRREVRKLQREKTVAKQRAEWEALSEEDRAQRKAATKKAKEFAEERLRRILEGDLSSLNVCIDLGFEIEIEHSDKEKRSLCKQLQLTWSVLKRAAVPIHLHVSSLGQLSTNLIESLRVVGFASWSLDRHDEAPWNIWPRSSIVLLSPDAVDVVESFDDDKVYVIGGIVDRTVQKAVTLGRGASEQVQTMRLPIPEYLGQTAGNVLNIDTVVQIICKHRETGDWASTLSETIPLRRKGPTPDTGI